MIENETTPLNEAPFGFEPSNGLEQFIPEDIEIALDRC